ncbi:MAG: NUDIX hydrolase [Candidatus Omnitrophica bacterium]|nr:NUDIX hydrolase [Candidatus Omnitrophota bacterium]
MTKHKKITIHKGKHLHFVCVGEWEYVERPHSSGAVIILAMTDENKVIFIEQFRPPVQKKVIEFPAGLIGDSKFGKKESFIAAARRELLEETGYTAKKIIKVLDGPASCGISSDMVVMVQAIGLKKVGVGGGVDGEVIEHFEVPLDQAEEWLAKKRKAGRLVGPRIYTGLYFLNKYNSGNNRSKVTG